MKSNWVSRIPVPTRFALALIVIGVLSHWQWFVPGYQFRWGDSAGPSAAAFPQFGFSYGGWLSLTDLGGANIQPYQLMFIQTWHILAAFGADFPVAEQITMLWPIAILSFLSPYLFIRRLLRSDRAGFAGALVYGLSASILLYQGYEVFLALAFSITPLVLVAMDVFLERRSWNSLLVLVLTFCALSYIEIRIAFLTVLLTLWFVLIALYRGRRRLPDISKVLVGGALIVLLNIFWIIVIVQTSTNALTQTTGRGVFGNNLTNFVHAITLVPGSWVNGTLVAFALGPIPPLMWILPALAIAGMFSTTSSSWLPSWAVNLFAATIAFGGVLLATQGNPPLPFLFPWVYSHVPGFSLFRTGTDFAIVASLGYGILIGQLFINGWQAAPSRGVKIFRIFCQIGLAAVILCTLVPAVDGQVGSLFVHRSAPQGLQRVEALIGSQSEFFRTLWLPSLPVWSTYSLSHPAVGAADLLGPGQPLEYSVPYGTSTGSSLVEHLGSVVGRKVLQKYSIRYLILPPPDSPDTGIFYLYYGEPRSFYLKWLNNQRWLTKVPNISEGYNVYRVTQSSTTPLIDEITNVKSGVSAVINSSLLVGKINRNLRVGDSVSVSMLNNQNWHAYLVPLKELAGVCQLSGTRINHCKVGSGFTLLLNSWLSGWQPLSHEVGSVGQLKFRVSAASLKQVGSVKGTGPEGIILVFGPAAEEWSWFLLAQLVLGILILTLLLRLAYPLARIWRRKTRSQ